MDISAPKLVATLTNEMSSLEWCTSGDFENCARLYLMRWKDILHCLRQLCNRVRVNIDYRGVISFKVDIDRHTVRVSTWRARYKAKLSRVGHILSLDRECPSWVGNPAADKKLRLTMLRSLGSVSVEVLSCFIKLTSKGISVAAASSSSLDETIVRFNLHLDTQPRDCYHVIAPHPLLMLRVCRLAEGLWALTGRTP